MENDAKMIKKQNNIDNNTNNNNSIDSANNKNNDYIDDTIVIPGKRKLKSAVLLKNEAVLLILSKNFIGKSFIVNKSRTTIGRHDTCDITINDPLISKEHCVIFTDHIDDNGSIFFIEDLDSSNSTFLNKKKVGKATQILYGDRIVVGDTILRLFLEEKLEKD